jgi:hypothetical protein
MGLTEFNSRSLSIQAQVPKIKGWNVGTISGAGIASLEVSPTMGAEFSTFSPGVLTALNPTTYDAGILIFSPVPGLRPSR